MAKMTTVANCYIEPLIEGPVLTTGSPTPVGRLFTR
jgi:hypothetical protein